MLENFGFHSTEGTAEVSRKHEYGREKYLFTLYDGKSRNRAVIFGISVNASVTAGLSYFSK